MIAEEEKIRFTVPDPMTEPCSRFIQSYKQLLDLVSFVSMLAFRIDEFAAAIAAWGTEVVEEPEALSTMIEDGVGAREFLHSHFQLLLQMTLCRAVDNYLAYVSELLALVFRTRPETMKSREKVELDMVLQHKSMDDLVSWLAEKRVNELSYEGMRDLSAYLSKRLRFELFDEKDELDHAVRIIGFRNVIVHNRGVVNRVLLSRLPGLDKKLGETIELDPDTMRSALVFLAQSVFDIDTRAAIKFDLPRPVSKGQHA
jgi:hypothetical protein